VFDGETWMLAQELPEGFPLVGGGIIQQHNDRATQVPQQLTQKHTDLFLGDVVVKEQIVKTQAMSPRAQLNSRNDRDFVPTSLAMTLEGSAAPGCPSLGHQGSQQKARFVRKN